MIVDVHTHIPIHLNRVPVEELKSNPLVGRDVRLTGSIEEYLGDLVPVDRAIVCGMAQTSGGPEPPIMDWRRGW